MKDYDFIVKGHEIVHQMFARTRTELVDKIRMKGLSDLAVIPDNEFHDGLEALETYCRTHGDNIPVYEDMDLFMFQKAQ